MLSASRKHNEKITGDTLVYLSDIRKVGDLFRSEAERLEGELFDSANDVKDPIAFQALLRDVLEEVNVRRNVK